MQEFSIANYLYPVSVHIETQKHPAHSSGLKRQALDHNLSFFLPAGTLATDSRRNASFPFSLTFDHALPIST